MPIIILAHVLLSFLLSHKSWATVSPFEIDPDLSSDEDSLKAMHSLLDKVCVKL